MTVTFAAALTVKQYHWLKTTPLPLRSISFHPATTFYTDVLPPEPNPTVTSFYIH